MEQLVHGETFSATDSPQKTDHPGKDVSDENSDSPQKNDPPEMDVSDENSDSPQKNDPPEMDVSDENSDSPKKTDHPEMDVSDEKSEPLSLKELETTMNLWVTLDGLPRDKFTIRVKEKDWKTVKVVGRDRRSLNNHAPIILRGLEEHECHCVLVFKQNRVKKNQSRKKNTAFYNGTAECKFQGCQKFYFKITKEPRAGKDVKIRVRITGKFNHEKGTKARRHICEKERDFMKEQLKDKGTSHVFYQNLGEKDNGQLSDGNYNHVPNKNSLRQMLHEVIVKELLDRDVHKEIEILKDLLDKVFDGGYVRFYSKFPFGVLLFSDDQLKIASKQFKEGGVLYFDATGEVVDKIPEQPKRVLYYTLVIQSAKGNPPITVCDFITNKHTVPDLTNFLTRFKYDLEKKANRQLFNFTVVVDDSWAMIHSTQLAFNQMTTADYLDRVFRGQHQNVAVKICAAHILRHVSRHMHKRKDSKAVRNIIMPTVAAMVTAKSLQELSEMFKIVSKVMLCAKDPASADLDKLTKFIENGTSQLPNEMDDGSENDELLNDEEELGTTDSSWVANSPYYKHFHRVFEENLETSVSSENDLYNPTLMKYIVRRLLSIAPLWTGIMSAGDYNTNAVVENWFKIVKETILLKKKKLRPGVFVKELSASLLGRIKEYQLQDSSTTTANRTPKRKKSQDMSQFQTETWGKKKKKQKGMRTSFSNRLDQDRTRPTWLKKKNKDKDLSASSLGENNQVANDDTLPFCPWGGDVNGVELVNTCTIDNLLLLMHLVICNNQSIRTWFAERENNVADTLLSVSSLFNERQWARGKLIWIQLVCPDVITNRRADLYGTEHRFFTKSYGELQESVCSSTCSSEDCPEQTLSRFTGEISLRNSTKKSLQGSIDKWLLNHGSPAKCRKRNTETRRLCHGSRTWSTRRFTGDVPPRLIVVDIGAIDYSIRLGELVSLDNTRYMTFGLTYWGGSHFVCRFEMAGTVWLYERLCQGLQKDGTLKKGYKQVHAVLMKIGK